MTAPRKIGKALFISDLHLSHLEAHGIRWFQTFTKWIDKSVCEELFILGDLFDYWVGPKQLSMPGYEPVLQALRALTGRGIAVTVLRGNRDPYLEGQFEARTGATVGEDLLLVESEPGSRILLMHGDLLCTRDRSYQRFRRFLRSRFMSWAGPRLPLALSLRLAQGFRRYSQRVVPQKYPEDKSIVEETVKDFLREHEAQTLVCGHIHERREVEIDLGNRRAKLIVLPAFEKTQPPLIAAQGTLQFASLS